MRPLAACRGPAGSYNILPDMLYAFEHETQDLLIHAPYTRIVVCWHISNMPWGHICYDTPMFCITAIFVKYCFTTFSWLLYCMSQFTLFRLLTVWGNSFWNGIIISIQAKLYKQAFIIFVWFWMTRNSFVKNRWHCWRFAALRFVTFDYLIDLTHTMPNRHQ